MTNERTGRTSRLIAKSLDLIDREDGGNQLLLFVSNKAARYGFDLARDMIEANDNFDKADVIYSRDSGIIKFSSNINMIFASACSPVFHFEGLSTFTAHIDHDAWCGTNFNEIKNLFRRKGILWA